ncbi:MAG: hypothetical protein M3R13_05360 [Armatimonadota bacterium]|nr:hypothetical protein [Armatimonadota bacterium]
MIFHTVSDDDDRDIERRGQSYATRRDVLIFGGIAAVLVVLAYVFLFRPWKANRDFVVSQSNLQSMSRALGLYAEANNDGLPPAYLPGVKDTFERPSTWANQLFPYTARVEIYNNATAPEEGNTTLTHLGVGGETTDVELSYGMLAAADTARRYEIRDATILLAETIGSGVDGSFNPMPLGGKDGFLIGYDNSNSFPNAGTKFATRLAFTGDGDSPLESTPIHPKGTLGIRADGGIAIFETAAQAFPVRVQGQNPSGQWVPY